MEDLPIFDSNDDGRESQRKQKEFLSGSPTQTKHSKHTFSDLELQDPLSLPPTRKFGGWGQDGVASGQAAYGRAQTQMSNSLNLLETKDSDDELNIPVIPDLAGSDEPMSIAATAEPPSVIMNRIVSYRELDQDLAKRAAFAGFDRNIDLKLLTRYLLPESEVQETDEAWDWDRLFADISEQKSNECLS